MGRNHYCTVERDSFNVAEVPRDVVMATIVWLSMNTRESSVCGGVRGDAALWHSTLTTCWIQHQQNSTDDSDSFNIRKCSVSRSRCTKKRLAAELCPDPLGELTALRMLPSRRKGPGVGREGRAGFSSFQFSSLIFKVA